MPEYRTGTCYLCGDESEKLLIVTGFDDKGRPTAAYACPKCRRAIDAIRRSEYAEND